MGNGFSSSNQHESTGDMDQWSQQACGLWVPKTPRPQKVQRELKQSPPDQPKPDDREGWDQYWFKCGQPWRREPEIAKGRQEELEHRRQIPADWEQGIYPFGGMILTRADIEWLLATHEGGRGPIDWRDKGQRERGGLDLRGVRIAEQTDLSALPLAKVRGGLSLEEWSMATDEQQMQAGLHASRTILSEAELEGADLRGAMLEGAALSYAMLEGADLGSAKLKRAHLCEAKLEGADLSFANLEGARLCEAKLEGADLSFANLEGARLCEAKLEGADFREASLEGADLRFANLKGADFSFANLKGVDFREASLEGADLRFAKLEGANLSGVGLAGADLRSARLEGVNLNSVRLADSNGIGPKLADVHWGETSLTVVDWSPLRILGDEQLTCQPRTSQGEKKDHEWRQREYRAASRANHQLSVVLRDQGLTQDGDKFAYRAKCMERMALRYELFENSAKRRGQLLWPLLFSWVLFLLAGYGYRLRWCLLWPFGLVALFTLFYWMLDPVHMPWWVALGESVNVFHGRGAAPSIAELAHPVRFTILTIVEAVIGLVIETVFVATVLQKFFGK
jgi:uncharacterized protein YjbI with pentapeptide repeats